MSNKITADECAAICKQLTRELAPNTDRSDALRELGIRLSRKIDLEVTFMNVGHRNTPEHASLMDTIRRLLDGDPECGKHIDAFAQQYTIERLDART
jgi:hypothetical protein